FGLGAALAALERPAEAEARWREAILLDPAFAPAHQKLALLLASRGDVDGALPHFLTAARLDPGAPEAAHNLRLALRKTGRADAALRALSRAGRDAVQELTRVLDRA